MKLRASFAKIVGTPTAERDSWVNTFDGLFLVLEVSGPLEFPVASLGKKIIEETCSDFQGLQEKKLTTLKRLVEELRIEEPEVSLSLVLGAQVGKVLYLICHIGGPPTGRVGRVILKRGDKIGMILEGQGCASGILEDKDIVILASPRFSEIVSPEEIYQLTDNFSPPELAERLAPLLHRAQDTSGAAALILQFASPTVNEEEEWGEEKTWESQMITQERKSDALKYFVSPLRFLRAALMGRFAPKPWIIQGEEERKKRVTLWVAVILVILLGVSIFLGLKKKEKSKIESRFNQTYQSALHQYEEGKALLGLNNQRAITLFGEGKEALLKINKDFQKGTREAKEIEELLAEIGKGLEETKQAYKLTPLVFFDLGLIKEGSEGEDLEIKGEQLIILDKKNSSLYQIEVGSKSSQILAGGEDFSNSTQLAVPEGWTYVLAERGILKVKIGSREWRMEIGRDKDWGEIVDMATFAGNLYLLDKTNGKIWKYIGNEAGFSEKRNYLVGDHLPSLSASSSIAIDGSVWLTTEKILKFTQGRQESFEIAGLDQPLGTILLIFTSDETKNLYVLDRQNNRIVVLEKNGNYKSQYLLENLGGISDVVVDETNKAIFLLSGSKIYQIELKF